MENREFISIEDVAMWYPYKGKDKAKATGKKNWIKAVDGVSLSIKKGEILGIIGESGCGKSTLGRILTRLEKPTKGDCFINGVSTGAMIKKDAKEFHKTVQIVFQNPFDTFTPRDTIGKILMRPLKNYKIGKNDQERYQICLKGLEQGGLRPAEDIMKRFPHELSGGQLQRISIIRSMFLNPQFIIADEPVSALDVSIQAQVLNLLNKLKRELGLTILFIAHDLSVVKYFSDYIGVMNKGRLVEQGTPEEIYSHPIPPYTKALLSAIPVPDPAYEKWRGYVTYDPSVHDYSVEKPSMHHVEGRHYVYLSDSEMVKYIK